MNMLNRTQGLRTINYLSWILPTTSYLLEICGVVSSARKVTLKITILLIHIASVAHSYMLSGANLYQRGNVALINVVLIVPIPFLKVHENHTIFDFFDSGHHIIISLHPLTTIRL